MPSIQSKAINILLRLMCMKRTVNRMRQRVESGERTYSEPSKRLDYHEYDQMVHDWMLGPLPEARHAIAEIVDTVSSDGRK